MSSILRFPDAETITKYLSEYKPLNSIYYRKNGITRAVTKLAAKRLANTKITERVTRVVAALLISDVHKGKGSNKKLSKTATTVIDFAELQIVVNQALIDCAESFLQPKTRKFS